MKSKQALPAWVIAVSVAVAVIVIAFFGYRTLSPNDAMADGHGKKIFTPADIEKFRAAAAKQSGR